MLQFKVCVLTWHAHSAINTEKNTDIDCTNQKHDFKNIELQEIVGFYVKNTQNLKVAIININSIRYKFKPLEEALINGMLDIFIIQESKLN